MPFGRQKLVGIICSTHNTDSKPEHRLKRVLQLFEPDPAINDSMMKLLTWAAGYYCHPRGECLDTALPRTVRRPEALPTYTANKWSRTELEFAGRKNASKQKAALDFIASRPSGAWQETLSAMGYKPALLRELESKGYLRKQEIDPLSASMEHLNEAKPVILNGEQKKASAILAKHSGEFQAFLLQGVTGSGKTEVYIDQVKLAINNQQQALVLIPEINLTPQTLARFQSQLASPIGILHSGASEKERFTTWSLAKRGIAKVVIGTRSAIFAPFENLGLIVIDEEHDTSYKQMDGFRYSARDLAVKRAQLENCPIILGSATPSLESLANVSSGKYQQIQLEQRAGSGEHPLVSVIDIRSRPLQNACSAPLLEQIGNEIKAGNQVIVFQNRRGYAPALMCYECGWIAPCLQCDSRMTVHNHPAHLRCHHCDAKHAFPSSCQECNSNQLQAVGSGTARLEYGLSQHFPSVDIIRVDRDSVRSQKDMEQVIERVNTGAPCILVGTQMLAKGHDFHNVTLVAIVDADAIFFSADFRAMEKGAQQLLQVAGRTGRGNKKGKVLIQTRQPEHPIFGAIIRNDYTHIAEVELDDRETCELPPFSKMVSIRAESKNASQASSSLEQLKHQLQLSLGNDPDSQISGPIEALITRKSGIYRYYLHLFSHSPAARAKYLACLRQTLSSTTSRQTRITIDVDPLDYL